MPIGARLAQEARTMALTGLPRRVSQALRGLGPCFRQRHQLVFSWLVVLPMGDGDRANLKALARQGPAHLAYQQDRRLRCAAYWCTKPSLWGGAGQAWQALPPPEGGSRALVGDSTPKGQRGAKPPVAQKPRLSPPHPDVFGLRLVRLRAQWEPSRLPVECALLRRTDDPAAAPEKAWFRPRRQALRRPVWGQELVVTAEAA